MASPFSPGWGTARADQALRTNQCYRHLASSCRARHFRTWIGRSTVVALTAAPGMLIKVQIIARCPRISSHKDSN